jgi:hemerythrin-like domain-containing protein
MPTPKTQDAIAMLKADHDKVKKLFDQFEKTEDSKIKKKIVAEALMELKLHATVEENFFYPAVRSQIDDEEGIMDEADEEHHVAKVLIAELDKMTGEEEHWEAKFTVLSENIRHHIKEEESDMFPEARKTDIDFVVLGQEMKQLKEQLQKNGVPPDAEAEMVGASGLRGDSPAKNAQKKIDVPLKEKASR